MHDLGDLAGGHTIDDHLGHACNERRFAARVVVEDQRLERRVPVPRDMQNNSTDPGAQFPFPRAIPAVCAILRPLIRRGLELLRGFNLQDLVKAGL